MGRLERTEYRIISTYRIQNNFKVQIRYPYVNYWIALHSKQLRLRYEKKSMLYTEITSVYTEFREGTKVIPRFRQ